MLTDKIAQALALATGRRLEAAAVARERPLQRRQLRGQVPGRRRRAHSRPRALPRPGRERRGRGR